MGDSMVSENQSDDVILPASSVVVQPLIPKLGHEVEEIRVRAAKNILFKLEHKLVCVSDLVHERQLLIGLLEWFNFSSVPLKRDVLGLLERLAKHVSAAQTLISIGGVEFLSHLRQDTDPELYQSVDNVIHQLLSLPQQTGSQHEQWCLYKTHEAHGPRDHLCHDVGLSSDHHATAETAQGNMPPSIVGDTQLPPVWSPVCCHVNPSKGFFSEHSSCDDRHQANLGQGPAHSSLSSARLQGSTPVIVHSLCADWYSTVTSFIQAYQSSSVQQYSVVYMAWEKSSFADTSSLMFFPWLSLTASDRHILSATNSRLQSRSSSLVAKSCEFLSDVLFKDFPAEIFLQRPSVSQSLLELLDDTADEEACLPLCSMLCLRDLCHHLHVRLSAVSDAALHCPNQDCWKSRLAPVSMDTEPPAERREVATSVRERGDGGVGSEETASSSSEVQSSRASVEEDEDRLLTETLKFNQLSLEEFCVTLLSRLAPLLQGRLGGNATAVTTVVELLHHVLDLLRTVIPDGLWQDKTHANTLMAPSLLSSMECLGEVIVHHMRESGYSNAGADSCASYRVHTLPAHRMAVLNLASFLVQLLCTTVPLDVAPRVIPSELGTVIWMLAADGILGQTHKHLRHVLLQYLAVIDPNSHAVYLTTARVAEAMICTCSFIKTTRSKGEDSLSEQIDLAARCIPSLAYHRSVEYVTEALQLCSRACQSSLQVKTVTDSSHVIVLQLLSHPDHVVRGHAYKNCLALVRAALKVSHVTEPQSTVCQVALFLVNPAVIYQICAFGLYDENATVQSSATELITILLLGRLSMSGEMWKRLLESIMVPLPLLQGCTGLDTSLDQTLLEIVSSHSTHITAEGDLICLPVLERYRGTLRFMFVKDPSIRAKAFECLVLHLTKEGGSAGTQNWFRGILSSMNSCDMFIADKLTCAVYSHSPVSHPTVNTEEVHKLYSIFNSRSMDVGLRKSSAQQLAIILQDPRWHGILLSENADEVALAILKEVIEVDGPVHTPTTPRPKVELVLPCLTMIRLLAEYNAACRRRLAQRLSVYSIVTKCILICQHTTHVQYEASCLMVLLLFTEVAMVTPRTEDSIPFSLPRSLVKRFQFPFNPPVHTAVSPHQVPGPDEPDPLRSEPAVTMLRMAWNLGWHESLERLCQVKGVEGRGASETDGCLPALQWRPLDQHLLRACHVTTALAEFLDSMKSAISHHAVQVALTRLTEHLLTDLGAWDGKRRLAVEVLYSLTFDEALERYLQVVPNSPQDDDLLIRVLKLLEILLTSPLLPPQTVVTWMSRIVLQSEGPLMTLLKTVPMQAAPAPQAQQTAGSQSTVESKRSLRKHVLNFLIVFIRCLSRHTDNWRMDGERVFIGDLAHMVALNLDLADNPQYYDLPVLERALQCLACITAQPHWNTYCRVMEGTALCSQMLSSLVQVVSAFHAGRLGASMSFMGKGVTFHASLCLVHLAYEMACTDSTEVFDWFLGHGLSAHNLAVTNMVNECASDKAWVSHWVHKQNPQDVPLSWLVPLVADRWPEVRWMGLSVVTVLVRIAQGRNTVFEASEDTGGLLWNLAFTILLDDAECGLVRQQATLLLCTLTASGLVSKESTRGQSPQESVMDVDKLISFLDELEFYRKLSLLLSNATDVMPTSQGTSRACQSSASMSRPSSSNSEIPYKPLLSSSQSVSVTSEATQTAVLSASHTSVESNDVSSINGQSAVHRSGGTPLSESSSMQGSHWTQPSQTPTSMVPLFDERGLPSGMSNTSTSSWLGSVTGSIPSVSNKTSSGVTPGLVSAVARLLHNLILVAPEKTVASLDKTQIEKVFVLHLDSSDLQMFLGFYQNSPSGLPCWAELMVPEVLGMHRSVVTSLDAMMRADHTVFFRLQQDEQLLHRVITLLAIDVSGFGPCLQQHLTGVREAVSRFLVTLLQNQGAMSVSSQTEEALYQHWTHFTAVLVEAMKTCSSPPSLRLTLLKVLCLLLCAEGKRDRDRKKNNGLSGMRTSRLATLLDSHSPGVITCSTRACNGANSCDITEEQEGMGPSGSALCNVLLDAHECGQLKQTARPANEQRDHVTAALSALLAVSQTAKNTALQAGLVETSLEQIKHLHVQLNMNSLQLAKGPSWKRKEPLTKELNSLLALLRNFMNQSSDVKAACVESGLVDVLHKLWAWCTVDQTLLPAVLNLLCTLTAGASKACTMVAGNTSVSGATTFMQSLLKFAAKTSSKMRELNASAELDKHVTTLRALFGLLSNLALSAECRGVIWKNNFLQHFSSLKPLKSNQTKQRSAARSVAQSWLRLLVNLTWFTDGQQMVVKTSTALHVLLELSHARHTKHVHDHALLVLRNLCFHGASKPVLLANERILSQFIESLSSGSLYTRALAASSLCSLLQNCQKAKVSLKKAGLLNKLDEMKIQEATVCVPKEDKHYKIFCEGLETLEKVFHEHK